MCGGELVEVEALVESGDVVAALGTQRALANRHPVYIYLASCRRFDVQGVGGGVVCWWSHCV